MAWMAENVRFVASTAAPLPLNASTAWSRFEIGEAQVINEGAQQRVAGGQVGDAATGQLILQMNRVELLLSAIPNPLSPTTDALEDVDGFLAQGAQMFGKLLESSESITRLSIVSALLERADSAEATAALFRNYLPIDLPPEGREPQFSLNVRKPSQVLPVDINHLCRWVAGARQILDIEMVPGLPPRQTISGHEHLFSAVFDINTVPQTEPFDASAVPEILAELLGATRALISDGYAALL